jgi:hypothetical protein
MEEAYKEKVKPKSMEEAYKEKVKPKSMELILT